MHNSFSFHVVFFNYTLKRNVLNCDRHAIFILDRISKFVEEKMITIVVSLVVTDAKKKLFLRALSRSGPVHITKYESYALATYERLSTRSSQGLLLSALVICLPPR